MPKSLPSEYLPQAEEVAELIIRPLPTIDNAEGMLADETIQTPPILIEGLLHKGLKAVLGGSSKTAKTWTALDISVAVATGGKWVGRQCTQGKVLFVNFEIPRAFFRERLRIMKVHRRVESLINLDVWTLRGHAAELSALMALIVEAALKGSYDLIVIDPIYKCYGNADENKASDIARLCNELERIAVQTGAAILYAAHYSKGNQAGKDPLDRIAGSGVFIRDADTALNFTKHEEPDCYTVDVVIRNLPEVAPFVVEWRFPAMELRADLNPLALKESKRRSAGAKDTTGSVLALVPLNGKTISKEKLLNLCAAKEIGERRAIRDIAVLVDEKKIFPWELARPRTRPAIAYARSAQSTQGEITISA